MLLPASTHRSFARDRRTPIKPSSKETLFKSERAHWKSSVRVPVPRGTPIPPTVGIDSEYTSYPEWVPKFDPKTGKPLKKGGRLVREERKRNIVLSYQLAARWGSACWAGILYPKDGRRFTRCELIEAAFQAGIDLRRITYRPDSYVGLSVKPTRVVRVVAHEARAELAHLADFNEPANIFSGPLKHEFDAVQKTFATIKSPCLLTPSDRSGHYHAYYISLTRLARSRRPRARASPPWRKCSGARRST